MSTVVLSCSPPVTQFTALGVTINQAGVAVDSELLVRILQAAAISGISLTQGGVAANITQGPVPILNPGTGAPTVGVWPQGQLCIDSTGAMFVRSGSVWVPVATPDGSPASIDCGGAS